MYEIGGKEQSVRSRKHAYMGKLRLRKNPIYWSGARVCHQKSDDDLATETWDPMRATMRAFSLVSWAGTSAGVPG